MPPAVSANLLLGNEEELRAKAEWLAKRIQAKRALAARLAALGNTIRTPSPEISRVETEMSLILSGIFVGAIALSFTAVYFSMPAHKAEAVRDRVSDLVSDARNKAVNEAKAGTQAAEIASDMATLQGDLMPPSSPASMQVAGIGTAEDVAMQVSADEPGTASPNTLNAASVRHEMSATRSPSPEVSKPLHKNRTMKHRSRQLAASCTPRHPGKCSPQYVVSFKRFWGPVLEERVYPNRRMTRRARLLWDREGKILEVDGSINEKYVVKPKTFSPIPGYPVS
jgi:hypothetical protein